MDNCASKPEIFLANYEDAVYENGMYLRQLLLHKLPGITALKAYKVRMGNK